MITRNIVMTVCGMALLSTAAQANLCTSVRGDLNTKAPASRDLSFYKQLFPDSTYHGNDRWNKVILQCNRKRDTKGNKIAKVTTVKGNNNGKKTLRKANLKAKVIRGKYNFFGAGSALNMNYVYVLSKKNGVWTMTLPYKPILSDLVKGRVDFNSSHASKLYTASAVAKTGGKITSATNRYGPRIVPATRPISKARKRNMPASRSINATSKTSISASAGSNTNTARAARSRKAAGSRRAWCWTG